MIEGDTRNRGIHKHQESLDAEPIPLFPLGEAPDHLDEVAVEVWDRVTRGLPRSMLRSTDRYLLESYCTAVSIYRDASRKYSNSSMIIKGPSGQVQQSPFLTIVNTHC